MDSTMREVLELKGRKVFTVTSADLVGEAVEVMTSQNVGSVVVMHGGKPMGVLSERDVVVDVVAPGRDPWLTRVGDLVEGRTFPVARPDHTISEVMQLMTERRCRHIPVCDGGRLMGVVSIGDLTKWVTKDLRQSLTEMHCYVAGPYAA